MTKLSISQKYFNTLFSLYENERTKINSSKKSKSLFYKDMEKNKQFILMGVILHNYKNIVNNDTKNIVKQTITRIQHIPSRISFKMRVNILNDIAKNFNDFVLPYTGYNLIVEFKGKKHKEFINSKVVFDCINSSTDVVFVMSITPCMYCVICLDNREAEELHRDMNGIVLNGEKYDFTIHSRFIQPNKNIITQMYNWEEKAYTKNISLPFNNILVPINNIIELNETNRNDLVY